MKIINKKISFVTLTIFSLVLICVGLSIFYSTDFNLCDKNIVESLTSPDGLKKATVFVLNCGATTDWAVHVSVTDNQELVSNLNTGNVISLDSNNGKAWPLSLRGWPLVKPEWENPSILNLYVSKDSNIFYQKDSVSGVGIKFIPISEEYVSSRKLEIR